MPMSVLLWVTSKGFTEQNLEEGLVGLSIQTMKVGIVTCDRPPVVVYVWTKTVQSLRVYSDEKSPLVQTKSRNLHLVCTQTDFNQTWSVRKSLNGTARHICAPLKMRLVLPSPECRCMWVKVQYVYYITAIFNHSGHIGRKAMGRKSHRSLQNVTEVDDIICDWNFTSVG